MTASDHDRHLLAWLDQPGLDLRDVDAAVVHPGGDGAASLLDARGCRVTSFDALAIPRDAHGSFGLVVAAGTVSEIPPDQRDAAMIAVSALVGSGGYLVATFLLATSNDAVRMQVGPPWALMPSDLAALKATGLERLELAHPRVPADVATMEARAVLHRRD